MPNAHVYQIFYNEETRKLVDPAFIPLDNSSNERPDWREYWPIRRVLSGAAMNELDFYGFLSPRFFQKTGLTSERVLECTNAAHVKCDFISFSPHPEQHALFWNIFEQGEWWHPGISGLAQQCMDDLGYKVRIEELIMDCRNAVFSNYFLAKPAFWRQWFDLNEKLFSAAEKNEGELGRKLRLPLLHRLDLGAVEFKVFIMERTASLLLAMNPEIRTMAFKPFERPLSVAFGQFIGEAVLCDALKIALVETGDPTYRRTIERIRNQVRIKLGANRRNY